MCSVFFGISLYVLSSQTLHHPWSVGRLLLHSSLCLIGARIFLSISAKTSWVHRNFLFRPWTLCVYRGEAAYVYLLHRFVIFSFLTSHHLRFLCRTYRAGIDAPFRVLCFSSCSSSFPFLDFLKLQWACFHWWVFLYRKVRERWVMQVPLSLLSTFFQKLLPRCLPKLFKSGGWNNILKYLSSVTHLYSHFVAV